MSDYADALAVMQRLCSAREYCSSDMHKKLNKFDITPKERAQIIKSLEQDGFLDDRRYARAFVKDKSALSGWGPSKIKWQLKSRGIEGEIIDEAMSEVTLEFQDEKLFSLLSKKKETLKDDDLRKMREKLIRFSLSRGFEYEATLRVLNRIISKFADN